MARLSILDRRVCPVCFLHFGHNALICGRCGTHLRDNVNTAPPIGQVWWVFFPPTGDKYRGWVESTVLGLKMVFDESTTPTRPKDFKFSGRTREDDAESEWADKQNEKDGVKGRPL